MPRRSAFPLPAPIHWPGRQEGKDDASAPGGADTLQPLGQLQGVKKVSVGNQMVRVEIDPDRGPKAKIIDGRIDYYMLKEATKEKAHVYHMRKKEWVDMTSTEQEVMVYLVAKRNLQMDELKGADYWPPIGPEEVQVDAETARLQQEAMELEEQERRKARCNQEMAREAVSWFPVPIDAVLANHARRAPGMIYGIEFPWNEDSLAEMGPQWLTAAFHRAGTLSQDNAVTSIILEKKIKVTGGNNGGKFLFEVRYLKPSPELHTKLFAKVPFPCSGPTKSDRLSSSVYKQPMDLVEINTYRLVEARFPMQTPKFYYGDISNETSNFILITERIPYAEIHGRKNRLEPFEIEGPYDKCKDFQLRDSEKEYYVLLMQMTGRLAGVHKSGRFGNEDAVSANLTKPPAGPENPMAYGFNPVGSSGEAVESYKRKLDVGVKFFGETASVVFPPYATEQSFQDKFTRTLLTWNAYSGEIEYFKVSSADYVALGHNNLNVDNAYFWRDEVGRLDCGVIDWGGFGVSNLGHKIYWLLNCADFEHVAENLDVYLDAFIASYHEYGGPLVDKKIVRLHVFLTCIANLSQMIGAIPNGFSMCAAKEWETIKDRSDPRISENINGKSTLRSTLRQVDNGLRFLEELQADEVLEAWIQDTWIGEFKQERKPEAAIFGA